MIEGLKDEIGNHEQKKIDAQLGKLGDTIERYSASISDHTDEIELLLTERRENWSSIQESRTRLAVIEQLSARFKLLREHYDSDMERFRFLSESEHFLSQLGNVPCPICGNDLDSHFLEHSLSEGKNWTSVQEAVEAEASKLELLISDLVKTLTSLEDEREQLNANVASSADRVRGLKNKVANILEPTLELEQEEFNQVLRKKGELEVIQGKLERLSFLQQEQAELGPEPTKSAQNESSIPQTVAISKGRRRFCDALESRLGKWKFQDNGTIEFDTENDVVIDGQARRTHGKGVRAIIHAGFTQTLMNEFRDRHPRFVVIDSPLTSFKEPDRTELSQDVQHAFYTDLSRTKTDVQIIILENKEPPSGLVKKIHYEHFSGSFSVGRQGFYPVEGGKKSAKKSSKKKPRKKPVKKRAKKTSKKKKRR